MFFSCLNLGMFSEVVCNQFTEDASLPRVVCTVFGLLIDWYSSRFLLICIKPKRCCNPVVSAAFLLIAI